MVISEGSAKILDGLSSSWMITAETASNSKHTKNDFILIEHTKIILFSTLEYSSNTIELILPVISSTQ